MVTYGFYNSYNHDRRYNAIQMSSIFDGIIRDGIFMSIGDCFTTKANGEDMMIAVGPGRAWFNHTWTLNDAILPLEVPESEVLLDRIDAVVIEVNSDIAVRANAIKIIKGTPSSNPVRPTMANTVSLHQYPLAYINVAARTSFIRTADITIMVGQDTAPYVTGILEMIDIEALVAKWEDQWKRFFEENSTDFLEYSGFWKSEWQKFYQEQTAAIQNFFLQFQKDMNDYFDERKEEYEQNTAHWKQMWDEWFYPYKNQSTNEWETWTSTAKEAFILWWDGLKAILEENCCAKLAEKVLELENRTAELEQFRSDMLNFQAICPVLYDNGYEEEEEVTNDLGEIITNSDGQPLTSAVYSTEPILDDTGDPILTNILFTTK